MVRSRRTRRGLCVAGLVFLGLTLAAPTHAASPCETIRPLFMAAAEAHGVDPALVAGIIAVESGFRTDVKSRSGARGPMQIMPATGRGLGCGPLGEPRANIDCGVTLLARHLAHYDGRVLYALAAYRLGRRDPDRARRAGEPVALSYVEKVVKARARYLRGGCAAWGRR